MTRFARTKDLCGNHRDHTASQSVRHAGAKARGSLPSAHPMLRASQPWLAATAYRRLGTETLESRRLLAVVGQQPLLARDVSVDAAPIVDPAVVVAPPVETGQTDPATDAPPKSPLVRNRVSIPPGAGLPDGQLQLAALRTTRLFDDGSESVTFGAPPPAPLTALAAQDGLVQAGSGTTQNAIGTPDIIINAGPTLAANQAALDAFNRAAEQWEAMFSDPIIVTIDADLVNLGNSNVIGQASSVVLIGGYDLIRNQLVSDADADDGIVTSLPTAAQFTATLPPGIGLTGNLAVNKAALKAAGFGGLDSQFGATDATIEFNTQFAFDFDNSDGVTSGTMDFETVAAHEIGHALGFTSAVDIVDFLVDNGQVGNIEPDVLDLFRFADDVPGADPANAGEFTTFDRELTPGVTAIIDDTSSEWLVSTGVATGDGRQASHWKDNNITGQLIGVMDPTLAFGQVVSITNADLRALDLVGWDIVFAANQPPVLDPIADQTIDEGSLLSFTATASDPDPGDQLTFSLAPGAPSGATIDPNTGLFQWTPDDNTPSPVTVTIIVSDDGTPSMSDQQDVQITINNVAPTLAISGPATGVPGQPRTFTFTATDPSSVDQGAGFTFDIDWDGDSVVDETVVGPSGVQVVHVFNSTGSWTISATATDQDGGVSPAATAPIDITLFDVQADEVNPSVTNLAWGGTAGLDAVFFIPTAGNSLTVFTAALGNVLINQVDLVSGIDGRIIAYGLGGADIMAADFATVPVEFYGDNGNDVLSGSAAAGDLLDGGAGDDMLLATTGINDAGDTLLGGDGRDFLFAHLGADSLDGGAGEDLLIAGNVAFNNGSLLTGLSKIRNEWLSSRDYATRVANISGTGSGPRLNDNFFLIPGQTVFSDAATDQLLGGNDLDWFLYGFLLDTAQDPNPSETQTNTDI